VITRDFFKKTVAQTLERSRVVTLLGPRQCGKTTLAREFLAPREPAYFDLEDPADLLRLEEPKTALEPLRDLVVIDEVQRRPELFPLLRVLVDRVPNPAKFLVLGSASPRLLRQTSESLAGRMETIEMTGLSMAEVGVEEQPKHWLRGGFPLSFLAGSDKASYTWRKAFIASYLERDLPELGLNISSVAMRQFWNLLAHYHGQIWNASEMATAMGLSAPTTGRYLDLLTDTYMVRQLQPWAENIGKRQVKSPKIYFRDSGLFHSMLGVKNIGELQRHPKIGASWEGYALEEVLRTFVPDEAYFWATHNGAELDLLLFKDGQRIGVECKYQDAPRLTPSMKIALEDLKLDRLLVIYPGLKNYRLAENVEVQPLFELTKNPEN
jgi:uncharacterized protein